MFDGHVAGAARFAIHARLILPLPPCGALPSTVQMTLCWSFEYCAQLLPNQYNRIVIPQYVKSLLLSVRLNCCSSLCLVGSLAPCPLCPAVLIMLVTKPDAAPAPPPTGPRNTIHFKLMSGSTTSLDCGPDEPFSSIKQRLAVRLCGSPCNALLCSTFETTRG